VEIPRQLLAKARRADLERTLVPTLRRAAEALSTDLERGFRSGRGLRRVLRGPPGTGKSHLAEVVVRRAVARGGAQPSAVARCPARGLGLGSLLDLYLALVRDLAVQAPDAVVAGRLDALATLPAGAAERSALALLAQMAAPKRLVLLLEDAEILAGRLGDEARGRMREDLERLDEWAIVATVGRDAEVVQSLLGEGGDAELVRDLPRPEPVEIHRLARGLQRGPGGAAPPEPWLSAVPPVFGDTLVAWRAAAEARHARADAPRPSAAGTLLATLDRLSPWAERRLAPLSPQQLRLLVPLAELARGATVSELASLAFVTPQAASSQLGRLADLGLVRSLRQGRRSFYEWADPALAAWVETQVAGTGRLEQLLDFFTAWETRADDAELPAVTASLRELLAARYEARRAWRASIRALTPEPGSGAGAARLAVALVESLDALAHPSLTARDVGLWRDLWWEWGGGSALLRTPLRLLDALARLRAGEPPVATRARLAPPERRLLPAGTRS
jgi:DNA-binding transcriptional ArsR family regulator